VDAVDTFKQELNHYIRAGQTAFLVNTVEETRAVETVRLVGWMQATDKAITANTDLARRLPPKAKPPLAQILIWQYLEAKRAGDEEEWVAIAEGLNEVGFKTMTWTRSPAWAGPTRTPTWPRPWSPWARPTPPTCP
jgi:hypothetical protein